MWMLAINQISTKDFLTCRGIQLDPSKSGCSWCDSITKNSNHLFFKYSFLKSFWSHIFKWWGFDWKKVANFDELFALCWSVHLTGTQKSLWLLVIAASCWIAWLAWIEKVYQRRLEGLAKELLFNKKIGEGLGHRLGSSSHWLVEIYCGRGCFGECCGLRWCAEGRLGGGFDFIF